MIHKKQKIFWTMSRSFLLLLVFFSFILNFFLLFSLFFLFLKLFQFLINFRMLVFQVPIKQLFFPVNFTTIIFRTLEGWLKTFFILSFEFFLSLGLKVERWTNRTFICYTECFWKLHVLFLFGFCQNMSVISFWLNFSWL